MEKASNHNHLFIIDLHRFLSVHLRIYTRERSRHGQLTSTLSRSDITMFVVLCVVPECSLVDESLGVSCYFSIKLLFFLFSAEKAVSRP
jgi:hypothetical protein